MCFISTLLSSVGIYDTAVKPQTPCTFPWIQDSFLCWKLFHPNTSKPLFSDFVCVALHKRFLKVYCEIFWENLHFFVVSKSHQVPDWRGSTPEANFFLLNWFVSVKCLRKGGGISLLQGRGCSFEPVLNVTLHHTICFMSSNSRRADCKGTEGWGVQGWKEKKTC